MSNEITVVQEDKPLTSTEIQKQIGVIQDVMKKVMKENVHYGKIPGCGDQKTLLKPGAEKIAATFRLSVDPEITDLSVDDVIRYRVKVRMTSPSGVFVGAGIGEASTGEEKYKWRKAVCKEEWDEADPGRRRTKWASKWGQQRGQRENYTVLQVRSDPADLANTVLKIAKKRAMVDAVLTATAASDIFAQDLEDLPEEIRDELVGSHNGSPARGDMEPKRQSAVDPAKTDEPMTEGQIKTIQAKLAAAEIDEPGLFYAFEVKGWEGFRRDQANTVLTWIGKQMGVGGE